RAVIQETGDHGRIPVPGGNQERWIPAVVRSVRVCAGRQQVLHFLHTAVPNRPVQQALIRAFRAAAKTRYPEKNQQRSAPAGHFQRLSPSVRKARPGCPILFHSPSSPQYHGYYSVRPEGTIPIDRTPSDSLFSVQLMGNWSWNWGTGAFNGRSLH